MTTPATAGEKVEARVEKTNRHGVRVFGTDPKSIGCFMELADPTDAVIVRIYENPDSDDKEILVTRRELIWLRDHGIPAMLEALPPSAATASKGGE